jgi:hypothetical protein
MENSSVDREYLDAELASLATDPDARPEGWTEGEVSDFRILIQCARAAQLDTDLRNSRMLRIEPDGTGNPNTARATLSPSHVINLTFKTNGSQGAVAFGLSTEESEMPR